VYTFNNFLVVIAIRQRFGGHAQQVGMAALGCAAQARNGRYIVIVDDDIDITDIQEVLWAMETRVEPSTDIKIVDDLWTSPLDPVMTPEKRKARDYTNGRAIFYAVRPFTWKDEYPKVSRTEKDLRQQVVEKYKSMIPFPNIY
jgi:3-polyprenyl-4-hydroxybenzoate decarboxylase